MSDEVEVMWRAFLAESDEHLEAADALIARADAAMPKGAMTREDIASLFRAFHSLKGLSQALDLSNMQAIAHHAEDLLGVVREGRAALDEPRTTMLQEVVDRLRRMRDWVETNRADPAAETDLILRLGEIVREASGTQAPVPAGAGDDAAFVAPSITDDQEMLAIYGELLTERVRDFVDAIENLDGGTAADTAEELIRGAEFLELDQLAGDLRSIASHARALPDTAARAGLVLALAQLSQQLALLEELSGVLAGAAILREALETHARGEVIERLAALRAAIAVVEVTDRVSLGAVATAAAEARAALQGGGMPNAASVVLLVEEQASRCAGGELVWTEELAALAGDVTRSVENLETDIDLAVALRAQTDWQSRIRGGDMPPTPRLARIANALPPELRGSLTDSQHAHLEQRAGEGWHAFDLLLDTEAEPEIASDLAAWLSANTDVITSRTVTAGGMNWFEFLFVSRQAHEQVRAALLALDADQRCMRGLRAIEPPGAAPAAEAPARAAASVIRVRVDAIENLMDSINESRVTLGGLSEALRGLGEEFAAVEVVLGGKARALRERLAEVIEIEQRVDAMQHRARALCIALRVVPIDTVFGRLPRLVRDLSQRLRREVDVQISGRDARLDKSMADLLIDPLMHLVRNALDHGIEAPEERLAAGKPRRARLEITATEQADGVVIAVRDDGRGLDRAAILARGIERGLIDDNAHPSDREIHDLIFREGFSTAQEVTEISGRGVGLDVVGHTLARIGGTIDIETVLGRGTCFTMAIPSSASLQNVLLVHAGDLVAIPERRVTAALVLETIEQVGAERVVWYRDRPVPLHDLSAALGYPTSESPPMAALIVEDAGRAIALAVEQIPERREVFIKEPHPLLAGLPMVAAATLLSDGRPVLILDIDGVLERVRLNSRAEAAA